MTLVQQFAGIPITLPGWTQVVAYLFLALLALLIGVLAWRTYLAHKNAAKMEKLDEIHAKTNMIFLILRGIQEGVEPDELQNEHYAPEQNEVTLDHGKPLVQ